MWRARKGMEFDGSQGDTNASGTNHRNCSRYDSHGIPCVTAVRISIAESLS